MALRDPDTARDDTPPFGPFSPEPRGPLQADLVVVASLTFSLSLLGLLALATAMSRLGL